MASGEARNGSMASPVNRTRRRKAFQRGNDRPQGSNPYRNVVLADLWKRGRERRLLATGGVMPLPPRREDKPPGTRPPSSGERQGSREERPRRHRGWT